MTDSSADKKLHGDQPTRVRYAVLSVLCSLAFLTYFDRICISQVQNEISRDLDLGQLTAEDWAQLEQEGKRDDHKAIAQIASDRSNKRMSWIFIAFMFGYAIMEAPAGWLGDKFGPRSVIFRIVVVWSIFTALTGSADLLLRWVVSNPSVGLILGVMILVRFVFGLGEGGAFPNVGRVMARWFPFRDRAFGQGLIWTSCRLGGAIAPVATYSLSEFVGWRQAFGVLGAIGIVWAIAFFLWFRDRPEDKRGVNQAEVDLIRTGAKVGSIHDDSGHKKVPWRRILLSSNLWALNLASGCVGFSWYFNVTFLPKYLLTQFGVDFNESKWISGSPLLAGAVGCLVGGKLSDYLIQRTGNKRWGRSLQGVIGFGMAGIVTLFIPSLPTHQLVIGALCLASVFQDLAIPIIWAVTADIGERYAATVAGCMNCVNGVGGILGIWLAPRLAAEYSWNHVFIINGCVYLLGALLWLRVNATERIDAPNLPASVAAYARRDRQQPTTSSLRIDARQVLELGACLRLPA
ncbi:MAG TPA: MFS transporter [Gemmataceae bacterium]|nr:MFS transporter [Gemmataceae bacterium]